MNYYFQVTRSIAILWLLATISMEKVAWGEDRSKEFVAKLSEICRKYDVPAMSAAVVNAEGLVKAGCYGVRKRGTEDKVEMSDRFPMGSNTKSMTGTLAAVLVEAGKIDWKTTIGEVWPNAKAPDIHPKLRNVTLDQLLSHQSGLPANVSDVSERDWASFFEENQSPTQERRRMLKIALCSAPSHPQGEFAYSNLGYAVASAMMETRAGESFESLMRKYVFDPLEMHSADFRSMQTARKLQPPLLWGHQADGGSPVDPRAMGAENPTIYAAAGTVHLSIEDYAKYARWHVAGRPLPVLRTQDNFDHLHEPLVDKAANEKYACGWISVNTQRGPALTHAGSNTNSFAVIWLWPESDFAAIACTNSGESKAYTACDEMISYLMKE